MHTCLNKRDAQHAANLGKGPVSFHPLHFHAGCIEIKLYPTEFATKNIPVPTNIGIIRKELVVGAGFAQESTIQKTI